MGLRLGQEPRSIGANLEVSLKMGVGQEPRAIVVILTLGPARSLGSHRLGTRDNRSHLGSKEPVGTGMCQEPGFTETHH